MPQNFIECGREQAFLVPPSLRDWLPEDHLAWFVIETVARLDLGPFYAAYRVDGRGRAAYEPSMMVSLVLFAYATSERSSRGIERRCRQGIASGVSEKPTVAVADAQYWNEQHMDHVTAEHGIQILIPPDSGKREGERPGWTGGRYSFMRRVLKSDLGRELYRKRQESIEPVHGHTKHNRKIYRFNYRGRRAVRTEWRLVMMTHNLAKLHRHQIAALRA